MLLVFVIIHSGGIPWKYRNKYPDRVISMGGEREKHISENRSGGINITKACRHDRWNRQKTGHWHRQCNYPLPKLSVSSPITMMLPVIHKGYIVFNETEKCNRRNEHLRTIPTPTPAPIPTHTYAHMHAHTHTHTHTRTRMHTRTRTSTRTHTHAHARTHVRTHARKDTHTRAGTHARAPARTNTCTRSRTHARIHIHA